MKDREAWHAGVCGGHKELDTTARLNNSVIFWASLVAQMVKILPTMQKIQICSLGQEYPLEKSMATHPVSLPEEFYGQRSLADYCLWGHTELDTTD